MVESSYNTDYYGDENNKKPSFINKIKLTQPAPQVEGFAKATTTQIHKLTKEELIRNRIDHQNNINEQFMY